MTTERAGSSAEAARLAAAGSGISKPATTTAAGCGCAEVAPLRREMRALRVAVEAVPELFEHVEQLAVIVAYLARRAGLPMPDAADVTGVEEERQ